MAFGGIGDIGQLVGIESGVVVGAPAGPFALNPPGTYVQFGANGPATGDPLGLPNDADRFWQKRVVEERAALQSVLIRAVTEVEAAPENLLEDCGVDGAPDVIAGTTHDVGILSTALPDGRTPASPVPGGKHFLPANFGKGRNNWIEDDISKIRVEFWVAAVCQLATGEIPDPVVRIVRFVPFGTSTDGYGRPLGNLEIVVENLGLALIPTRSAVLVTCLHSIQN